MSQKHHTTIHISYQFPVLSRCGHGFPVDFDPCSVEKPGLIPPEVILALPSPPLETALPLPDPGLAPPADTQPEPEGHGYDHGLPPSPPTSASEGEEEEDDREQVNNLDFITSGKFMN